MADLKKCPKCKRLSDPDAQTCDCGYSFADGTMRKIKKPIEQQPLGGWRFISLLAGGALGSAFVISRLGAVGAVIAFLFGYYFTDHFVTQPLRRADIPLPKRIVVITITIVGIVALWIVAAVVVDQLLPHAR